MKMLTKLTIAAMLFTAPVMEAQAETSCEDISEIAAAFMQKRQENTDIILMMKAADAIANGDVNAAEGLKGMIKIYYSRPAYATKEMQQRAIMDAKNEAYLACIGG